MPRFAWMKGHRQSGVLSSFHTPKMILKQEQGFNEVEFCMDEYLSGEEFGFMVLLNMKHVISMEVSKFEKRVSCILFGGRLLKFVITVLSDVRMEWKLENFQLTIS